MADCLFCKIVSGEIPSTRIYENDYAIVIDDIKPVVKVHALVITKEHYQDVLALDPDNAGTLSGIQQAIAETAKIKGVSGSGFRLISNCGADGGQTVPHLHYHLIGGQPLRTKII